MTNLPKTHPLLHEAMISRQWTVQQNNKYAFTAVACDQAIEQTVNRAWTTSGGLKGISLSSNATQKFILSHSQTAAITRQCEYLVGYHQDERVKEDLDKSSRDSWSR